MQKESKLILLVAIFVTSILVANTMASKLFVFGAGYVMTAGILAFPITFLITDIINEVWGKKTAQAVVTAGLFANILMVGFYQLGILLPAASFWPNQEAYATILGAVPRIVIASMIAYLISQSYDVWMFNYIKQVLPFGLWARNNVSTITAQVIDSAIFLVIAFWGVMPLEKLFSMFILYIVVKALIALMDTPFAYLGAWWARR
ncbi:MAG: Inner membrane protein YhhQ [Syntrophomonadaceae bacterium]|nr:Inner membrane protein YhhQ [Bacillota bacterium]